MSGFAPILSHPSAAAYDPTKHVNYEIGMVLGADDLSQEFAYHAHRDQWIVRDLVGYGTIWGLQVTTSPPGEIPEVQVSSGVAVNPRGQLIRVAPAQCAKLNDWLLANHSEVNSRQQPTGVAGLSTLQLYVVLSYRACLSDPAPIVGEPCCSERNKMAPSRLTDSALIELSFVPPQQQEEDAVREFLSWLRSRIVLTAGGTAPSMDAFLRWIRAAAKDARDAVLPPTAVRHAVVDPSPVVTFRIPSARTGEYLRAAFALFVTELRPTWRPNWLGQNQSVSGDYPFATAEPGNQVLLAALTLSITPPGIGSTAWVVSKTVAMQTNEQRRPYLLPLRFLQEWLQPASSPSAPIVVAAGTLCADGVTAARWASGGLKAVLLPPTGAQPWNAVSLSFDGYMRPQPQVRGAPQYVVKVLPWPGSAIPGREKVTVMLDDFSADGVVLHISRDGGALSPAELKELHLVIEISQFA